MPENDKQGVRSGHEGHRKRLRQRARATQLEGFQPHEVLELLLTYAIPRQDVNPLAHALIDRFGSLSGVLDASAAELEQVPGMGESAAVLLSSLVGVFAAYQKDRWGEKPRLTNRALAGEYCTALFARQQVESIVLICLDVHKTVIAAETLMRGTVDETPLYPRSVVECALRHRAHSVLLAHNHPSGVLTPSRGDIDVSIQVGNALKPVEIELLDHIVVAGSEYCSLYALGYLGGGTQLHPVGGYRRAAVADGSLHDSD